MGARPLCVHTVCVQTPCIQTLTHPDPVHPDPVHLGQRLLVLKGCGVPS